MGKLLQKLQRGNKGGKSKKYSESEEWADFDEDGFETEEYDEDEDYEVEEYEDEAEYYEEEEEYEAEEYGEDEEYEYEEEYDEDEEEYGEEYEDEGYEVEEYEDEAEYYEEEEEYEAEEYGDEEEYEYEEEYDEDEEEYDEEEYEDEEYEVEEYEDEAEYYEEEEEYEAEEYGEDEEYEYEEEYDEDEEEYEDEEYEDEEYEVEEYEDEAEYYEEEEEYEAEEYEDEEYYEDEDEMEEYGDEAEYYEEEYDIEDYEEEVPEGGIKKAVYKLTHLPMTDYVVALTGAAVLIMAVITGTLYFNARNNQMQIETFAEIGVGVEDIGVIGEGGLVAVADAQAAKLMAAGTIEEENNWEEGENQEGGGGGGEAQSGKTQIDLHLTSIQKDLKIKFINKKSGKLIPSVAFEVEIEKPSGGTYIMKDEDQDGIIYQTNIEPGKYKVKIISPSSNDEYSISGEAVTITVKDTIEYKKVDVADEVKTESQVNVAVEDTKVNETVVESVNKDTVEWVESTRTLIEGTGTAVEGYEKVDRSMIADPEQKAYAGFRLLAAEDKGLRTTDDPDGEEDTDIPAVPTEAPTQAPAADPTDAPPDPTPEPTKEPEPTAEPTPEPTKAPEPTAEPTKAPTPTPTALATATPAATATKTPQGTTTPAASASRTPSASPTASATATPTATVSPTPGGARTDTKSVLKTTSGETLYIKDASGKYVEAKFADYYNSNIKEFYKKVSEIKGEYKYTGWQEIDGVTFFFDKNGNKVTGEQVIQGAKYNFNSDGSLNTGSGHMGIDVSRYNGNIDWNAVKNSGVSYVIIRCGYRGSATGALVEDSAFRKNIQGAANAGLKVGVYFFTQAVNEVEAVEEASMVLSLIRGYNLAYPVFLDVEATSGNNGRADHISVDTRTAVCNAFCQTIQNSGYKAGIYANKTWFTTHINTPSLTGYKIWLAQYAAAPSYTRTKYDMWQYSSKGKVSGISGNVDMNISYMGY